MELKLGLLFQQPNLPEQGLDFYSFSILVYAIIAILAICVLIYKVAVIADMVEKGSTTYWQRLFITRVDESGMAFSIFNRVVIDRDFNEAATTQILKHERVHIHQRHSWDLVFYELLKILFWWHPVSYLAQRELQKLHEYLVDAELSKEERNAYQQQLLNMTLGCQEFTFTNPFNKSSLLKNRITMLQKKNNNARMNYKLLWIVPIVLSSLIYTACTRDVVEENSQKLGTTPKLEELVDLKDFKTGQVDFYKGLTDEEISLYEKYDTEEMFNNSNFIKTDEGQRFLATVVKISHNGRSYAIERDNNNQLVEITEYPDNDDVRYSDAKRIREFDLESDLEIMNEAIDYLNKKARDTDDSQLASSDNEIIEEKVEIRELSDNETINGDIIREQRSINDPIPYSVVGQVPHFDICTGTQAEIKKCTSDEITRFVNKNFNTGKFKHLSGRNKVTYNLKSIKKVKSLRSIPQEKRQN